jgi:hypothetical protein
MENLTTQADAISLSRQEDELAQPTVLGQPSDCHDKRLSRVLDYQANALAKKDALEANLGSLNSGLMRMSLWLDEAIEQAMGMGQPNVERLEQILPAIETHLRVMRQVDRFAQIELRANQSRKPRAKDNSSSAF